MFDIVLVEDFEVVAIPTNRSAYFIFTASDNSTHGCFADNLTFTVPSMSGTSSKNYQYRKTNQK